MPDIVVFTHGCFPAPGVWPREKTVPIFQTDLEARERSFESHFRERKEAERRPFRAVEGCPHETPAFIIFPLPNVRIPATSFLILCESHKAI